MTSNWVFAKRIYDEAIHAKYSGNLDFYKKMNTNKIYKADSLLREIVQNVPNDLNALKLYGKFHIDLISIINKQVLDPLENALQSKPEDIEILEILGRLYQIQFDAMRKDEDFQKSLSYYMKLLQIQPNDKIVIEQLKNLILTRFSHDKLVSKEHVEILEKYIEINKNDVDTLLKLANIYFDLGDYEKALETYKTYRKLKVGAYGISHNIAQCYIKLNQNKKAIALYEENLNQLKSQRYKSINYKKILYDLYNTEGFDIRDESEVINFVKKRKNEKSLATEFHADGEKLLKEGDIEGALDKFTRSIEMDPLRLDSHLFITGIKLKHKMANEAELDNIKQKYQGDSLYWSDLARMHEFLGDYHNAIEAYTNFLESNPEDTEIKSSLGLSLSKVDRFDEAIKIFKELIEINPRSAMQRYNLGLVYARMSEFTTALEYYVDALSMFKRSNQIIKSIVDAHHELGNNNLAKAYLNVILRRDPDDSFAKEKLAQLSQKS